MNNYKIREIFKEITGNSPYPFQEKAIAQILDNRKNMIITAPTGSGKTWLSCFPFIYAKQRGLPFADRMFYVLPQRTLVTAVADTLSNALKSCNLKVTVQMGGQSEDPLFEGDIIVTTIDQLLSTYIGVSYGSGIASSNIAPGAILGAYIVMDEFHLLEVHKALSTFIDLINRLHPFVRTVMMTATAPTDYMEEIANRVQGCVLPISPIEVIQVQKENIRQRIVQWTGCTLTAQEILDKHQKHTLVVVNTVKRAQQLYRELEDILTNSHETRETDILCLHARYLSEDRKDKESRLKDILKPENNQHLIVIGNQVVEVGLDVSADVLLTELCPANSLVQRIGRCTRYGEKIGQVYIYELETAQNGRMKVAPYETTELVQLLNDTRDYLNKLSPLTVTAIEEEEMIQQVHQNKEYIALVDVDIGKIKKKVEESLSTGQVSKVTELVRQVNNIQVIVHDKPWLIDLSKVKERFSIPISSLKSLFKDKEDALLSGRLSFYPLFVEDESFGIQVEWIPLTNSTALEQHQLISISPEYINYSKKVGIILGEPGSFISQESKESFITLKNSFSYTEERYIDHVLDVRARIRNEDHRYQVTAHQIGELLNVAPETLHEWCEWTGALHDIGKLASDYVKALHLWQAEVWNKPTKEYLSHSDFSAENPVHQSLKKLKKYRRKPHASEGAFASLAIIRNVLDRDLREHSKWGDSAVNALYFAIRRHHSAYAHTMREFTLVPGVEQVVKQSLRGLNCSWFELVIKNHADKSDAVASSEHEHLDIRNPIELSLYWFFVRRLRLADRKAVEEKNKIGGGT